MEKLKTINTPFTGLAAMPNQYSSTLVATTTTVVGGNSRLELLISPSAPHRALSPTTPRRRRQGFVVLCPAAP